VTHRQAGRQAGRQAMSTPKPIDFAAIALWIATRRTALDELERAMAAVQQLEGPTAMAVEPIRGVSPPRAATVRSARVPKTAAADVESAILAFLGKQRKPVTTPAIVAAVKTSKYFVTQVLEPLVTSGRVVRRGERAGTRIGLPSVMADADQEED
jgi:hypothetical protein